MPELDAMRADYSRSVRRNSRSCLGFVKAILCDKFLVADFENLFIIAASNPYREETSNEDLVLRGSNTVMRDFFQVPVQEMCSPERCLYVSVAHSSRLWSKILDVTGASFAALFPTIHLELEVTQCR